MALLAHAAALVADAGLRIVNVDCTLLIEQPKLAPYRSAIRESLAGTLALAPERVNVKLTTGEGIGFVGRREGVAALAIASLASRAGDVHD
jgi:2-C-methyl-D-erythritol 2,4-cyclodiphosphate synthase